MDSLSKFLAKSVTLVGTISGSAFAWMAQSQVTGSVLWEGMAVLALGSGAAGAVGWYSAHRRLQRLYLQRRERALIAAARQQGGRITDIELVAATQYPLEECRAFLQEMTLSGSAERHIGREGTAVYLFPGFLTEQEKRQARSTADWEPPVRRTTSPDFSSAPPPPPHTPSPPAETRALETD